MKPQLVQDSLGRTSAEQPEKTALVCGRTRVKYAEIDASSNRLANALIAAGLRRGDRVALYLENSVAAVLGIYAVLKAGATFVVVNHSTKLDKLAYILENCRASALIVDGRAVENGILERLLARNHGLRTVLISADKILPDARCAGMDQTLRAFSATAPPRVNIDLDLACLVYTSGSTGDPKGVMCDHGNVLFAVESISSYLRNTRDDIVLNVLPLSFDYGLYQLLMTFHFGGTLVLESSFAYPNEILKRIAAERVTGFPGVPTIFARLLQLELAAFDLSSLRYITNTAAALPPGQIQELRRRLPEVAVYSMYGLTETKRTLYLPPEELDRRPGSVGIAIPGTEAWLEDEEGRRLGPGATGELIVRGRHVMRGYWEAPEATALRFPPGPLAGERVCHTGDLFRMDEAGFFYFIARKDDMIKSRGEKVAPKEVENVLYGLAGVVEAAVVGVPDPILGQAVKAILVTNGAQLTRNQVLAHCRAHLEDFMVPREVEFRDALPLTSSGKVLKLGLS